MLKLLGGCNPFLDLDTAGIAILVAAIDSFRLAQERMKGTPRFFNRDELLKSCLERAASDGLVLEFGVWEGASINLLADSVGGKEVFGFDSIEGLPEQWMHAPAGTFSLEALPSVRNNVRLIKGWFDDTIDGFLATNNSTIALLHIDCDLYSSTKTILEDGCAVLYRDCHCIR